LQYT